MGSHVVLIRGADPLPPAFPPRSRFHSPSRPDASSTCMEPPASSTGGIRCSLTLNCPFILLRGWVIIILSSPEEAKSSFRLMASDKQDRRDFGPSGLGPGRSGCGLLTDLFPEVAKMRTPARAAQRAKESTAGQRLGLALGPQEGPANWPTLPGTAVTGACRWHPFRRGRSSEGPGSAFWVAGVCDELATLSFRL